MAEVLHVGDKHVGNLSPDLFDLDGHSFAPSPALYVSDNNDSSEDTGIPLSRFQKNRVAETASRALHQYEVERIKVEARHKTRDEQQISMLAIVLATLRRSLLTCKTSQDEASMDIGWPTNVRHVTHVTFDRFNGFLGLPVEFEIEIPRRVPSASASVFGVSPESMQCSYDSKGNSVPTILLLMQERLYSQGGLKAEGIFRINAENSHEEHVRQQLNKGVVPHDIDLHCLAGLIKAWFRELPKGVLDSLTPEQVLQCNTEIQCVQLVKLLPLSQAALLDWAINLMADVVQEESFNKMNARNIAMVFAPNMTQMVDPLTALMHAVQVMNFLKTLIVRTLRDRQEVMLESGHSSLIMVTRDEDEHDDGCSDGLLSKGIDVFNEQDDSSSGKLVSREEIVSNELDNSFNANLLSTENESSELSKVGYCLAPHSNKDMQKARVGLIHRLHHNERVEAW